MKGETLAFKGMAIAPHMVCKAVCTAAGRTHMASNALLIWIPDKESLERSIPLLIAGILSFQPP